jgi:hypothetical protein
VKLKKKFCFEKNDIEETELNGMSSILAPKLTILLYEQNGQV